MPTPNPNDPLLIFLIKVCFFSFIVVAYHKYSLIHLLMNLPLIHIIAPLVEIIILDYLNINKYLTIISLYKQGKLTETILFNFVKG